MLRLSNMSPVFLVTGLRQVGKATLLQRLMEPERKYVTPDDPDVRYLAKNGATTLYQNECGPFTAQGRLLDHQISGVPTDENVSENLAGRVGIISVLGLSDAEPYGYGGAPYTTELEWLSTCLSTVRERDLNKLCLHLPEFHARALC